MFSPYQLWFLAVGAAMHRHCGTSYKFMENNRHLFPQRWIDAEERKLRELMTAPAAPWNEKPDEPLPITNTIMYSLAPILRRVRAFLLKKWGVVESPANGKPASSERRRGKRQAAAAGG
jgi:hypothetical protein